MADEQEILTYIIRGQDQTKALLEQHSSLLASIALQAQKAAASVEDFGKKNEDAGQKVGNLQKFLQDFVGNTDNASNAAKNFGSIVTDTFKNPTALIGEFGSSLGELATGPIGIAIGAATALAAGMAILGKELLDCAENAVEVGANFENLSKKTSDTVHNVSSLSFATTAVGGTMTTMANAMFTLEQRIELNTTTVQRGLNELNKGLGSNKISMEQLADASPTEKMLLLSDAFRQVGTNVNAAAAIGDIFTKRFGKELLPLLDQDLRTLVGTSNELGATWSGTDAKAAKELEIQTNLLSLQFQTLYTRLGRELIPVLKEIVQGFNEVMATINKIPEQPGIKQLISYIEFLSAAHDKLHGIKDILPDTPAGSGAVNAQTGEDTRNAARFLQDYNKALEEYAAGIRDVTRFKGEEEVIEKALHADLETQKRDRQELAAIAKETVNAQLGLQTALIRETETGFRAQIDIAERTHAAHVAIINTELADARKHSADLAAEDTRYNAEKIDINNKANKALVDFTSQMEKEMGRVHEDANASWLSKRYDVIEADKKASIDAEFAKFGATQQFIAARDQIETLAAARRAAAESQADKKFLTDVTRVADDIEVIRVHAMEDGLAKQIELIDRRVKKEQDAAATLGFTEDQLQAYRNLLAEKGAVEIENIRVSNQKRINDELFSLESSYQSSVNDLNRAGTAQQLAQLEIQRDAALRDIQLHKENNKQLIDATNKAFDAQADVIKQLGVLSKQQYQHLVDDALSAYEKATAAGVESAEQLQGRWKEYWDLQHKSAIDFEHNFGGLTSSLSGFFDQMARNAGSGGLAEFAKTLSAVTGAIGPTITAVNNLARTLEEVQKKGTLTAGSFAQIASGALNFVSTATQSQSVWGSAIAGFVSAIQFGLQAGLAAAFASAAITAWENASKDDDAKAAAQQVGLRWGRAIGLGLAKSISDTVNELHVSEEIAEALNIDKILQETGGLGSIGVAPHGATQLPTNNVIGFNEAIRAMNLLLSEVAKHGADAQVALDALNTEFGKMVSFMNTNMHELVNPEMVQFIINARQSGEQIEALNQFLAQMAEQAEKGVNLVVNGFAGTIVNAFQAVGKATDEMNELAIKKEGILERLRHAREGTHEYDDLQRQLEEINTQFAGLLEQVNRWRNTLTDAGSDVDGLTARSDRMGRLLQSTFTVAIASGQSFTEALQAIHPSLEQLARLQADFGLQVSDTVQHLLDLDAWATQHKDLADSLDGLNQLMKGLANSGAVTQQTFTDLGDEAAAQFQDLIHSGLSADDAMAAMQPTLQTLYELEKRFGYTVDDATQQLLDQAVAAGVVGAQHETAAERTASAMGHVSDILEAIANYMGITIPHNIDRLAKTGSQATSDLTRNTHDLQDGLDGVNARFQQMGNDAQNAGDRASAGVRKVIYGSSPGGLDDLLRHLDDAIERFKHAGDAAAGAMDNANKHTKEYIKTLQDLKNQLELDLLGEGLEHDLKALELEFTAKWEDLKEKFKNEPLGLQEALDALQADYNVRKQQIQDKYNKEAADKQAKADKERADETFALQQQLLESQIKLQKQGIEQAVALLNLQKDAELKALKDKFGDQVEFYNQQAAVIEDIYANKIQQAIAENSKKIADENEKLTKQQAEDQQKLIEQAEDALKKLQEAYTEGMRSLEDELQDLVLDAMEDGVNKQLAILQVQKDRRLRALAEQFGAESDMYRSQAAVIDQIYGIQAAEVTAQGGNDSLSTLQKSFYALQNTPVQAGQEAARQSELNRLSEQIQAAQSAYTANLTTAIPQGLIPSNIGIGSQLAGLTADGTVRLEVVITDPAGNELSAVNFSSIEEAIATGRITLVARNSSQRSG